MEAMREVTSRTRELRALRDSVDVSEWTPKPSIAEELQVVRKSSFSCAACDWLMNLGEEEILNCVSSVLCTSLFRGDVESCVRRMVYLKHRSHCILCAGVAYACVMVRSLLYCSFSMCVETFMPYSNTLHWSL